MNEDDDFDFFDPDCFCCFEMQADDVFIPDGFTSVKLPVDLRPSAPLSFDIQKAKKLIDSGYKIVFDLDFGLHESDFKGFFHQSYLSSCQFAVDHFISNIVAPIQKDVVGAIFATCTLGAHEFWKEAYEPQVDTSREQFLHEQLISYLDKVSSYMPLNFERFLLIDAKASTETFSTSMLFQGFTLCLKSAPYVTDTITWQEGNRLSGFIGRELKAKCERPKLALLASPGICMQKQFNAARERKVSFKVIAEHELTLSWDGIDELLLPNHSFSHTTRRALDGFVAAGGLITQLT